MSIAAACRPQAERPCSGPRGGVLAVGAGAVTHSKGVDELQRNLREALAWQSCRVATAPDERSAQTAVS